jgi:hypothetical protein
VPPGQKTGLLQNRRRRHLHSSRQSKTVPGSSRPHPGRGSGRKPIGLYPRSRRLRVFARGKRTEAPPFCPPSLLQSAGDVWAAEKSCLPGSRLRSPAQPAALENVA